VTEDESAIAEPKRQIVTTKLHRPRAAPRSVVRPQLLDRLERGCDLPLTLICAPAGYGKTVLASQWLESTSCQSAWVSLDEGDNEAVAFLELIAAAVSAVAPGSLSNTRSLLAAPTPAPLEVLIAELANELDSLPEPMILVLDDYHSASSDDVDAIVSSLLEHPPESLHIVLLTRVDPAIGLAGLRAHGWLTEVRAADLSFTTDQIRTLLANNHDLEPTPESVSEIARKTEGWPAGVRLSLEASRHGAGPTARGAALLDSPVAQDFLTAEVLDAQPPEVRSHLLTTSILDRFCAPLCDAISPLTTEEADGLSSRDFLTWLERADLFVVPLDDRHEWFRYHHLFQSMLQRQLAQARGEEFVSELHRRACRWLSAEGLHEQAFGHALLAGDESAVIQTASLHGQKLLDEEQWGQLERWIGVVPGDLVESDAELLSLEAWLTGDTLSRFDRMSDLLDRAEALIAEAPDDATAFALGSVEALRGFEDFLRGDGEAAARRARRAGSLIPSSSRRCLTFALVLNIVALQTAGRIDEAVAVARSAMRDDRFQSARFPPWTWGLVSAWWLEADMERLYREGAELTRHGQKRDMRNTVATGEYHQGVADYQRNDLTSAAEHFKTVAGLRHQTQSLTCVHSLFGLALCRQAQGDQKVAADIARKVSEFAKATESVYLHGVTEAFLVELDLRRGVNGRAILWLEFEDAEPQSPRWMLYSPSETFVKALLAVGSAEARNQAQNLIAQRLEAAQRSHDRPLQVKMLGLRALLEEALGRGDKALAALREAVSVSEPGGAARLLADLGPGLAGILNRLDVQGDELNHVGSILEAIAAPSAKGSSDPDESRARVAIDFPGVDPLTGREADVLALLEKRFSNKEIAAELLIAPETVKKHSMSIYRKLNVAGRREAVEKAQALGYLSAV